MFFLAQASMPAPLSFQGVAFFAWGCFRYFWLATARSLILADFLDIGALAIVTNVGRVAVDADVPVTTARWIASLRSQ
jgi:hypothetical protein